MNLDALPTPRSGFRALLDDPALRSRFLPPLSEEEILTVDEKIDAVVDDTARWAAANGIALSAPKLPPLAILATAPFPSLSSRDAALRAKAALWAYGLDDTIDRRLLPPGTLVSCVDECVMAAATDLPPARCVFDLAAQLARLRIEMAEFQQFALAQPIWTAALTKLIDGMMYEYWLSNRAPGEHALTGAPVGEYIFFSRHSIANAFVMMTGVVADGSTVIDDLPILFSVAAQCGAAIRLANDLRTWQRERSENVVNAVALTMEALDVPLWDVDRIAALALDSVSAELTQARQHAREMAARSGSEMAARYVRFMDLAVDFYDLADLSDWWMHAADAL